MNPQSVAIIGENLVDLLVSTDGRVEAIIGGGPLNVARSIGRLGGDAHFISGISSDAFGALVRTALLESHVNIALHAPRAQPTTLAVVELDPEGPRYHFHLNDTAAFDIGEDETSHALARVPQWGALYFGTLGLLVEPMRSLAERIIVDSSLDTLVVIDPNCRPSAVPDGAEYRALVERLSARADVLKVSTEDLEYIFPGRAPRQGARDLLSWGASCVIVTNGGAPVTVYTRHWEIAVDVAPVEVIDTVGAGDALVGGFIRWWMGRELTPQHLADPALVESALVAAIDISRLTCQRPGAQPPRREDVAELASWRWL